MNAAILQLRTWRRPRLRRGIVSAAFAAFLGVAMFATLGSAQPAHADTHIIEYHNEDGSVIEIWQDNNGKLYAWGTEADGEQWSYTFDDNPNPDDPSSSDGPMTPEKIKEMIRKYAGEMSKPEEEFWDNFIGKYMSGNGDGLIPHYNPSDSGQAYDDGTGAGGGFDGNGGDILDQMRGHGSGGASGGQDKGEHADDTYGTETPKDGMYEDDMPGPPELINPNPVLRP